MTEGYTDAPDLRQILWIGSNSGMAPFPRAVIFCVS